MSGIRSTLLFRPDPNLTKSDANAKERKRGAIRSLSLVLQEWAFKSFSDGRRALTGDPQLADSVERSQSVGSSIARGQAILAFCVVAGLVEGAVPRRSLCGLAWATPSVRSGHIIPHMSVTAGERRIVSVLVADVAGSTPIAERLAGAVEVSVRRRRATDAGGGGAFRRHGCAVDGRRGPRTSGRRWPTRTTPSAPFAPRSRSARHSTA